MGLRQTVCSIPVLYSEPIGLLSQFPSCWRSDLDGLLAVPVHKDGLHPCVQLFPGYFEQEQLNV